MAIENRDLPAGTRLEANYRKTRYVCTVEAGEDGKLAFVLEDGKRFKSPSAAGSVVMGGVACNGWRFWTVEGDAPAPKSSGSSEIFPRSFDLSRGLVGERLPAGDHDGRGLLPNST